ncbi:hypothetical protein AB0K60_29845 [Thermopolyspora sp. NPDC052614]|uniref:hypothetical protein n=1 Tax=Thermopolyspora sp. NPDC052614 TaxID=3155682 RepID=UPI00341EAA26
MRKILATAAVAGIMTLGFAAAPAQAATSTNTQSTTTWIGVCDAVSIAYDAFKTIEVEGPGSVRDGLFNRTDLRSVADNDREDQDVRDAAKRLLRGSLFDRLDTSGYGGRRDGLISRDDLKAFYNVVCN